MSVIEGDSVLLHTDVTDICDDEDILWKFGAEKSRIAEISRKKQSTFNGPDGRFRDRLKLDSKTGSLTITNTRTEHAGHYEQEISGAKLLLKTFSVSVYGEWRSSVLSFIYSYFLQTEKCNYFIVLHDTLTQITLNNCSAH